MNCASLSDRKSRALAIVLVVVLFVSALGALMSSDRSEAAATADLSGVTATAFTSTDDDYSNLFYLNDKLPLTLSPSEWKRSSQDGFWYNVNQDNNGYGNVLTYGMVSGITNDVIRQDVLDAYSAVFTGTDFQIVQVRYTVSDSCSFTVSIAKAGMTTFSSTSEVGSGFDGYVFNGNYQSGKIYTVDTSAGDVKPAAVRGTYTVSMVSDGVTCLSSSVLVLGAPIDLGGTVTDAGVSPIGGAHVTYTDSNGSVGTVDTDSAGIYHIHVKYGDNISITSVSADNFEFQKTTYTYGTALEDVSPSDVVFKASEHAVNVTVTDQSSRGASGLGVAAVWYYQYDDDGKTIVSTSAPAGTTGGSAIAIGSTDPSGLTKVVFSTPVLGDGVTAKLVLSVDKGDTGFTAKMDDIEVGEDVSPLPAVLSCEGNAYADTVSYSDAVLKVEQSSVVMEVLDATFSNGVSGASLSAVWWYEKYDAGYTISSAASSMSWVTTAGTAWADSSDADGKAVVHYTLPAGTFTSTQKAYLFLAGGSVDNICAYSFDLPKIVSGSISFEDLCSGHAGCSYAAVDAVADGTLRANESSFVVTYEITSPSGVLPAETYMQYSIGSASHTDVLVPQAGKISFKLVVTKDSVVSVELSASGYSFDPSSYTSPAVVSDTICRFSVDPSGSAVERSLPVDLGVAVSVSGVDSGDMMNLSFVQAGKSVTICVQASSSGVYGYNFTGFAGDMVTDVEVDDVGSGLYVKKSGDYGFIAAHLVSYSFTTYCSTADTPTLANLSPNQLIVVFVDGTQYDTVQSNSSGIGILVIPDVFEVTYQCNGYAVKGVSVDSGPFVGYVSFNLHGIIDVNHDSYETVIVKYTVSANDGTAKEIVNPDPSNPVKTQVKVGDTVSLQAPALKGFNFSGWFSGGSLVTTSMTCKYTAEEETETTLIAVYTAHVAEVGEKVDMTVVAIGLVGVIILLLAFTYVVIQYHKTRF